MDTTIIFIIFLIVAVFMFLTIPKNDRQQKERIFNIIMVCLISFFLGLFIGLGHKVNATCNNTYVKPNKIQLTYKVYYTDSIYNDSILINTNKGEYIY